MNEKSIWDFLVTQVPVIVFMALVNYFQYKYFTKTLDSKDSIIDSLRKEITAMHKEQVEMTRQHLEAQSKTNEIMVGLKELLAELKDKK